MRIPRPVTIDFESFGILKRPDYPPFPVGVAIKYPGKRGRYYSWGHPEKNNCGFEDGREALKEAYQHPEGVLFQNNKFDRDLTETWFPDIPVLPWDSYHDSLFFLYLHNPRARTFSLKPSSEAILGIPPDEQDAVRDWLIKNQPVPGVKISAAKGSEHPAERYIAYAPGNLVGRYAIGDVDRTEKIFKFLFPLIENAGMLPAYDRERRLCPLLLEMERQGIRVDLKRLKKDVEFYNSVLLKLEDYIRTKLKAPSLDKFAGKTFANALISSGYASKESLGTTPGGDIATNKEALAKGVTDKQLAAVVNYRARLATCLQTFMRPWLNTALKSDGLIFTYWNQTRDDAGARGTTTGRMSSTPNFQNIPKEFEPLFHHEAVAAEMSMKEASKFPKAPFPLPPLPLCRSYIVPYAKDHVLIDRDYSQQELRILAHFEDGALLNAYNESPTLDLHEYARQTINNQLGTNYARKPVKTTVFAKIYGQGVGTLAERLNLEVIEAKKLSDSLLTLFPGIKELYSETRSRAKNKQPITTWGGRVYYCEDPIIVKGKIIGLEYKLPNLLIQGSAADCTKEAANRFTYEAPEDSAIKTYWQGRAAEARKDPAQWKEVIRSKIPGGVWPEDWKVYSFVHDETLLSVPKKDEKIAMAVLREAMESVEFDVPMLSDGKRSTKNWAVMTAAK